tara:strand:- start:78 stop:209 length:132 start_codon:yes stop_codon:yes gene_type:complete
MKIEGWDIKSHEGARDITGDGDTATISSGGGTGSIEGHEGTAV